MYLIKKEAVDFHELAWVNFKEKFDSRKIFCISVIQI